MLSSKEATPTSGKFGLRTALLVPFVLQIVAAVGLVGYLSFRNGQQAVNRLASQVRSEVASRTQRVMEDYLSLPHEITRSNINALRLNQIKLEDKEALERHFFYQLQTYPITGEIFVGMPDGSIILVSQKPDGSFVANTTREFPRREQYLLDNEGRRRQLLRSINYDARTRPWYKAAEQKRGQTWSEVYLFTTLQKLGISAVEPYYDAQGKLVAIFAAQFPLSALSDYLKTLKVSPTGQVFVLDRAGFLLATSTGEKSFFEEGSAQKQLQAVESQNLLTRSTARYLQQQFRNLSEIKQPMEISFYIDGKREYVRVQPYSDGKGLDFLVVVVVPEADFMEEINASNWTTLWLCLLALVVAIAISILISNWIANPILRIAQASEELAAGNFEQQVAPSQVIEIARLANSFNKMTKQLKDSFEKLNSIISQADRVGNQIGSSSSQIATTNKELEATAAQQAAFTNQVKATAYQIAANSGQLVKTMENIAQTATSTALTASHGQKNLTEMADAMDRLAEATNSIASRLATMNEKALNITNVVMAIGKVADQTNLLSLNAAIEAEKAGEAGTGFAVVAREVRRLADNSAAASQEIEDMVKDIQSSISQGVMEMDKFSQQVRHHVEVVGRISQQIAQVINQVQSLTPEFEQVSHSMEEQFEGAQQISGAISQLSESSRQTVASLQETNQVLDQLNDTAQVLQGIISMSVNS